jgi:hypothetical protein
MSDRNSYKKWTPEPRGGTAAAVVWGLKVKPCEFLGKLLRRH